jgi:hypothetical protein
MLQPMAVTTYVKDGSGEIAVTQFLDRKRERRWTVPLGDSTERRWALPIGLSSEPGSVYGHRHKIEQPRKPANLLNQNPELEGSERWISQARELPPDRVRQRTVTRSETQFEATWTEAEDAWDNGTPLLEQWRQYGSPAL